MNKKLLIEEGVGQPLLLAELRRAHQAAPMLPDERETTADDRDEMTNEEVH
ncbi:hypothetical protein [Streptomyces sp. ISID311]|uniref:hypothetical protein n=1 Tax=Streptomyces sp. ISID311 TaxID=2601673 RepID=UPI00164B1A69|nr:hypothetical protein [Streptomyces sp. ISID311]